MRATTLDALAIPPGLWNAPDTLDALADRDVGALFRLVRKWTGASQTHIGIATGLSQAQVSEIMSGARRVTSIDVLVRVIDGLQMPDAARTVLLLGDLAAAGTAPSPYAVGTRNGPSWHSDAVAVFATRSEFTSAMPPHRLFDGVRAVRAVGLSLNMLCQQYADHNLVRLLEGGAHLRCLFLDPDGQAVATREREEGFAPGHLSSLTRLNIETLTRRVRDRLPEEMRDGLETATYDETVRFNITLVDDLCVMQPYLPEARGIDSPTFVVDRSVGGGALYRTYEQVFESLWQRGRPM